MVIPEVFDRVIPEAFDRVIPQALDRVIPQALDSVIPDLIRDPGLPSAVMRVKKMDPGSSPG
jgi:hypothetical protein